MNDLTRRESADLISDCERDKVLKRFAEAKEIVETSRKKNNKKKFARLFVLLTEQWTPIQRSLLRTMSDEELHGLADMLYDIARKKCRYTWVAFLVPGFGQLGLYGLWIGNKTNLLSKLEDLPVPESFTYPTACRILQRENGAEWFPFKEVREYV